MTRRQFAFGLAGGTWIALIAATALSIFGIQSFLHYQATPFPFFGTGFIMSDPVIGYTGMPNAEMHHVVPPVYDVFTNHRGGRDSYLGQQAPESRIRFPRLLWRRTCRRALADSSLHAGACDTNTSQVGDLSESARCS